MRGSLKLTSASYRIGGATRMSSKLMTAAKAFAICYPPDSYKILSA